MALQGPLAAADNLVGYDFPQSYARICFARIDSDTTLINVWWYADKAAREANMNPVKQKEYPTATVSLTGDIFPAMYAYLKTLPDFAGYIDA